MTQYPSPSTLSAGRNPMAIVPTNIDEIVRLAETIYSGGFAPGFKNASGVATAILMGLELGLKPLFAVNRIAIINGRPAIYGDAVPALIYTSGLVERFEETIEGEGDARVARCLIKRKGFDKPIERTFSVQDAKDAGLWGRQGPWKQYGSRMLAMRARGFCARDAVPDILSGLYLREEIDDVVDVTPARQTAEPPIPNVETFTPSGPNDAPASSATVEGSATVEAMAEPPIPPIPPTPKKSVPKQQPPEPPTSDDARAAPFITSEVYRSYYERLSLARNEEDVEQAWREVVTPVFRFLTDAEKSQFFEADDRRRGALQTS